MSPHRNTLLFGTLAGVLIAFVLLSKLSILSTSPTVVSTGMNSTDEASACPQLREDIISLQERIVELEAALQSQTLSGALKRGNGNESNEGTIIRIPPVACVGAKPKGKRPPFPSRYVKSWYYFRNDPYWAINSAHSHGIPTPPPAPSIKNPGLDWPRTMSERCRHHIYAQGMQDGILMCIFMVINSTNKFYVEFGHSDMFEANAGSMYFLGWKGLFLDGGVKSTDYNLITGPITPENIVSLLERGGTPKSFDYLSADLDATEWYVVEAILKAGYRPRVFSMEFNINIPITSNFTLSKPKGSRWDVGTCFMAHSLGAQKLLADEYGYGLVAIDAPLDAFWVDKSLLHPDTKYIDNDDPIVVEYYRGQLHKCRGGWKAYPWYDVKKKATFTP